MRSRYCLIKQATACTSAVMAADGCSAERNARSPSCPHPCKTARSHTDIVSRSSLPLVKLKQNLATFKGVTSGRHLHGEAADVTHRLGRAALVHDRREAGCEVGLLANLRQEAGEGEVRHVMGHLQP